MSSRLARPRARLRLWRAWIHERPLLHFWWRVFIGIVGGAVIVAGLILVPLPGPGWLIVFIGLGILGTEFAWAHRLGAWVRARLARFWAWWRGWRARRRAQAAAGRSQTRQG